MSETAVGKRRWRWLPPILIGVVCGTAVFLLINSADRPRPYYVVKPPPEAEEEEKAAAPAQDLIWKDARGIAQIMDNRKSWKTTVKPIIPREGINSGAFIAHGHYIPRPYAVDLEGDFVRVNGIAVDMLPPLSEKFGVWKRKDPGEFAWPKGCQSEPPGFPEYVGDKFYFFRQQYGNDVAAKLVAQNISRLAGIAKVWVESACRVRYECADGSINCIGFDPPGNRSIGQAERQAEYENISQNLRECFENDGLLIMNTPTGRYLGNSVKVIIKGEAAHETVGGILRVVESPETAEKKLASLVEIIEDVNVAKELLENLEITDELRKYCE